MEWMNIDLSQENRMIFQCQKNILTDICFLDSCTTHAPSKKSLGVDG